MKYVSIVLASEMRPGAQSILGSLRICYDVQRYYLFSASQWARCMLLDEEIILGPRRGYRERCTNIDGTLLVFNECH